MAKQKEGDPLDVEIFGKRLREGDQLWDPISGGFRMKHPELREHVGLARAMLNGKTMYILCGTEASKGGLEKSLQRIRGKDQTGNTGWGAQMIRQHIDKLQLEVLRVDTSSSAIEPTKQLKRKMVELHDPEWNRPHSKRMADIRAGRLSAGPS